jgi:hypothetical protein
MGRYLNPQVENDELAAALWHESELMLISTCVGDIRGVSVSSSRFVSVDI